MRVANLNRHQLTAASRVAMSITLITSNLNKLSEFQSILGRHNIKVEHVKPEWERLIDQVKAIFASSPKVQFVMTESSDLYLHDDDEPINDPFSPEHNLSKVSNVGSLTVFFKARSDFEDGDGEIGDDIAFSVYKAGISGYIDQSRSVIDGFGWDAIFVVSATNLSYAEMRKLDLKNSVRNMMLGRFVDSHHHFLKECGWSFHAFHEEDEVLNFTELSNVIASIPSLTSAHNPILAQFGLDRLIQSVVNSGLYSKVASNHREFIYWYPGLAPIPLVHKGDEIHQTTFFMHDLMHYLFPDLIYTGTEDAFHRNVYVIYRMMSEAMTLVLADMFFVDTLVKQGVTYDFDKRKIYPLFQCLSLAGNTPIYQLRSILWANVRYALAGDDSVFRSLKNPNVESQVFEKALSEYKDRYSSFFKADYLWTVKNYENMADQPEAFSRWTSAVGTELFSRLNLVTLPVFADSLPQGKRSLDSLIEAVFKKMFSIVSNAASTSVAPAEEQEIRSKAYSRYLIGQSMLFYKWRMVANAERLGEAIFAEMRKKPTLSKKDFEKIDWHFKSLLLDLHHQNLICYDDYRTWRNIHPLFSPFYVAYEGKNKVDGDLADIARQLFLK